METPEKVVCCTLCLCMAVSVFSSVALVYLTALVYMPAKREIHSGLSDVPVMCTTIERSDTDHCDWYSCGEWCLSKSSNCVKLWAQVRRNGTDVLFQRCTNIRDITCKVLDHDFVEDKSCSRDEDCVSLSRRFLSKCAHYDDCGPSKAPFLCDQKFHKCVSIRQIRNCKNDDACTRLNHLFWCNKGLCENLTSVYKCSYERHQWPPVDCHDKRNCITLDGLFDCKMGRCAKIEWPWHCERRCPSVPTDIRRNVIILSGDRMVAAQCEAASNLITGSSIWRQNVRKVPSGPDMLMVSCTDVSVSNVTFDDEAPSKQTQQNKEILARDCVNGTLMPRHLLPTSSANYTLIHGLFLQHGFHNRLDNNDVDRIPFDTDIVIYNKTKILVNTEGCVNTLQDECTSFYLEHRRDGRNYSSRDRFPCYYTPHHDEFVTTRFSIDDTKSIFLISFAIPACLWIFSCSCLFGCSKLLRVEDNGHMRIRCRPVSSSPSVCRHQHFSKMKTNLA